MDAAYFRLLFDYNRWANERVRARAVELNETERARTLPGLSMGSILGTLAHLLGTEVIWLARCRGESPSHILDAGDLPTFAALRHRWREHDAALAANIDSLRDEDVDRSITYKTTSGEEFTQPIGQILAHIVNHGTQFRAEAAVALTALGRSPGDLDLILWLRQPR